MTPRESTATELAKPAAVPTSRTPNPGSAAPPARPAARMPINTRSRFIRARPQPNPCQNRGASYRNRGRGEEVNGVLDASQRRDDNRAPTSVAGWCSLVARWAHNPKVAGSNPAPATKVNPLNGRHLRRPFVFLAERENLKN